MKMLSWNSFLFYFFYYHFIELKRKFVWGRNLFLNKMRKVEQNFIDFTYYVLAYPKLSVIDNYIEIKITIVKLR